MLAELSQFSPTRRKDVHMCESFDNNYCNSYQKEETAMSKLSEEEQENTSEKAFSIQLEALDLAKSSQNLLQGEALTRFVKRSLNSSKTYT